MLPFQPVTCMLSEHAGLLMPLLYSPILIWQWVVGVDIGLTNADKKNEEDGTNISPLYLQMECGDGGAGIGCYWQGVPRR